MYLKVCQLLLHLFNDILLSSSREQGMGIATFHPKHLDGSLESSDMHLQLYQHTLILKSSKLTSSCKFSNTWHSVTYDIFTHSDLHITCTFTGAAAAA